MTNSCYQCRHLRKETESWELPHIWYWHCHRHPQYANLWSFPFKRTKCGAYRADGGDDDGSS